MIDKNDPRLTAYLLDELDDDSVAEVQAAIDASPELQEHVEGLRATIGVLQTSLMGVGVAEKPSLTDEQLQSIDSEVVVAAETPGTYTLNGESSPADSRIYWGRAAIAALVVYAVGVSYFAMRKPTATQQQLSKLERAAAVQDGLNRAKSEKLDSVVSRTVDGTYALKNLEEGQRRLNRSELLESDGDIEEPANVPVELGEENRNRRAPVTYRVETKTRMVPVTRTRTETRTRVVMRDGKEVEENYEVSVPYTENIAQTYTVQVPVTSAELVAESNTNRAEPFGGESDPFSGGDDPFGSGAEMEADPMQIDPFGDADLFGNDHEPRERNVTDAFSAVLKSDVELEDEPPIHYPDADRWAAMQARQQNQGQQIQAPQSGQNALDDLFGGGKPTADPPENLSLLAASGSTSTNQTRASANDGEVFLDNMNDMDRSVASSSPEPSGVPADVIASLAYRSQRVPRRRQRRGEAVEIDEMDMMMKEKEMGGMDMMGMEEMGMGMGGMGRGEDRESQMLMETPRVSIGEEEEALGMARTAGDSIAADPAPVSDQEILESGGNLLQRVEREREATEGRLRAEVRAKSRWAARQLRENPVGVSAQLKATLQRVTSATGIGNQVRRELVTNLHKAIFVSQEREKKFANAKKKSQKAKTWKPASAATNRARLSVGHHDDLKLAARDTYVRIDGFRARVFFDLYFYNDRGRQLEGQFLLRLPTDASLHYFAFGATSLPTPSAPLQTGKPGEDVQAQLTAAQTAVLALRDATATKGTDLARRAADADFVAAAKSTFAAVKSAHVVPRQKAALAYEETVRRRVDPALVEWAGPGIFQTKVFPLLPNQLHRIVVGYDVNLVDDGDDRTFKLDLPEGEAGGRVEFDIAAASGTQVTITPDADPFISGKRAYYRYENAQPRDYRVRLIGTKDAVLQSGKRATGDAFFATRVKADLPSEPAKADSSRAVFLLDTSWSDRPAAFSRRLMLLEQILKQNRSTIKEFAVLMFNVEQRWWRGEFATNDKDNLKAFMRDANTIALEGATDLHHALNAATTAKWIRSNSKSALPNYFLLSDGVANWGKTDLASLADPLKMLDRSTGGGALFAYHLAGHSSEKTTLRWLAGAAGGAVFDVAEEANLGRVATAHLSRPWQLIGMSASGTDEILIQGSASSVYPGQTLMIAGQGELKGPLKIEFERGSEKQTLMVNPDVTIASPAAARLYGQFAVEQLEPYGESLDEVTVAFARYFRVPGRTCSMVMLETVEDYKRFGVNVSPQEDRLVIASTSVSESIDDQELELLERRQKPLKQFTAWVDSLQSAALVKLPTALRIAMKRLPDDTFGFQTRPLKCRSWKSKHNAEGYLDVLKLETPTFDIVMDEADRKLEVFGVDDAIKSASTMVEIKPSDPDTLRSVAFRAIEWKRSDQAAPLLWRLAQARPYQPQCLLLLGRAMSESGDVDGAIVCYELVCNGNWNDRWASGAKDIARVELLHLLEQVDSGSVKSAIQAYARARLSQLRGQISDEGIDVAVVMHWNTDRTDVDLHVTEPSGEVCFYKHKRTKAGGAITQDITQGLGPEMYTLIEAPDGKFKVEAKYYSSDNNRTKTPSEILVSVFQNLGRTNATSRTQSITLTGKGEKEVVLELDVKH